MCLHPRCGFPQGGYDLRECSLSTVWLAINSTAVIPRAQAVSHTLMPRHHAMSHTPLPLLPQCALPSMCRLRAQPLHRHLALPSEPQDAVCGAFRQPSNCTVNAQLVRAQKALDSEYN